MRKIKNIDFGLFILRVSIGGMMLLHGLHKLQAPLKTIDFMSEKLVNSGLPSFLSYGVFLGEVLAPLLIIFGWRTKIFASFLAITMVVAVYVAHFSGIFSITDKGGWAIELQALYFFGAIALIFTGGGKIALSNKNKLWD